MRGVVGGYGIITICCGRSGAIDCWEAWAGINVEPSRKAQLRPPEVHHG